MQKDIKTVYSAFAVSRTGNRGAVSMLESAIDYLTTDECGGIVNVFTVYPEEDKKLPPTPNVNIYKGTPANLVFKIIPLCILYRIIGFLLPKSIWGREMKALIETDVCLLIGGTTFSDAQIFKVIYNVACVLPTIILGKKSIMYSQTIGPFKKTFNRICGKFCLSKVSFVVPRGEGSFKNVKELGIEQCEYFTDSAFTLVVHDEIKNRIKEKYINLSPDKKIVGISINSIVERKCVKANIRHNEIWANFIQYLQDEGYFVLLVPHSIRPNAKSTHNNDLLTIADILKYLPSQNNLFIIDDPYDCKELRVVVGLADYYVASRFHSMISALCTNTPVLVFGWGFQKYKEVMSEFNLEEYCFDAVDLSKEALIKGFKQIISDSESIKKRMKENLPAVQESSMKNHKEAARLGDEAKKHAAK